MKDFIITVLSNQDSVWLPSPLTGAVTIINRGLKPVVVYGAPRGTRLLTPGKRYSYRPRQTKTKKG